MNQFIQARVQPFSTGTKKIFPAPPSILSPPLRGSGKKLGGAK